MKRVPYALALLLSCGASSPVPPPAPLPSARVATRVIYSAMAPDTLIMAASWINSADDNRGPADSLRVRFVGIMHDTSYVFRAAPFPTNLTHRQTIPTNAYGGPGSSGTWDTWAQVTTYRRQTNSTPTTSPVVSINLVDAAPPPVTGVTFSAVKRP